MGGRREGYLRQPRQVEEAFGKVGSEAAWAPVPSSQNNTKRKIEKRMKI